MLMPWLETCSMWISGASGVMSINKIMVTNSTKFVNTIDGCSGEKNIRDVAYAR